MKEREPPMIGHQAAAAAPPGARPVAARPVRDEGDEVWVAGFWRRATAALVDVAVVAPLAVAAVWLASRLAGLELPPLRGAQLDAWLDLLLAGDPAMLGVLGLVAAISAIYLVTFHTLGGRTLGMRLLRLSVIDVHGDPPSALRSLVRTVGYFAAASLGGLGFFWVGFDREKRGLHDWLSGTYVIKPPPERGAR
jgi:uncharacterized RDD family membrane protein YckC